MGKRLSRIYTRTGDKGDTGLGTNERLPKHAARVQAMGDVDEVNSWVGHIRAALGGEHTEDACLNQIQHDLFDIGGELAMPGYELVQANLVSELEAAIDRLNEPLPALENFILPGGSEGVSRVHVARSVARRAERSLWALHDAESEQARPDGERLGLHAVQYLNRLSDYFFVLARSIASEDGGREILWQNRYAKD
ncbi:MAG: cob(I)yrinic acid a,c-diamide adenosyltransferase [Natronospirillum sp.]|uniref:cob(I)yrinic acid a,c-diamide adenosyltransferase n=1 Tax=Natronospirillum sp. TaxID=2812955 RepID=UPI0025F83C1B|nr:cob(I)yrinic acid a,c-diamide adenosyltransferase [Natronospirillum sp.]MCH8551962.1 cob(I)yrinic acid a,c-diamide adenosyltransferase [Natronospirillum sp.]